MLASVSHLVLLGFACPFFNVEINSCNSSNIQFLKDRLTVMEEMMRPRLLLQLSGNFKCLVQVKLHLLGQTK